ncbi:MAG TPA: hypothetical protein VGE34_03440 [Candidatus Saccharimonadales bacterium]
MPKAIDPLHEVTPSALPDQSNLSKLYGKPLASQPKVIEEESATPREIPKQDLKQTFVVNLIIATAYIISYLSISAIYALGGDEDGLSASDRVLMLGFSAATVFTWLFSFMGLRKVLEHSTTLNLSTLLVFYSFFIFPATKIVVDFHQYNLYICVIVSILYTLISFIYLSILSNALVKYEQTNKRNAFRYLIVFMISIMLIAILTTYLAS